MAADPHAETVWGWSAAVGDGVEQRAVAAGRGVDRVAAGGAVGAGQGDVERRGEDRAVAVVRVVGADPLRAAAERGPTGGAVVGASFDRVRVGPGAYDVALGHQALDLG